MIICRKFSEWEWTRVNPYKKLTALPLPYYTLGQTWLLLLLLLLLLQTIIIIIICGCKAFAFYFIIPPQPSWESNLVSPTYEIQCDEGDAEIWEKRNETAWLQNDCQLNRSCACTLTQNWSQFSWEGVKSVVDADILSPVLGIPLSLTFSLTSPLSTLS